MKQKLFYAALFIALSVIPLNAQNHNTGLGLRVGFDNGITLKHFFMPANAVEGILSFSPDYFKVTGMWVYQNPVLGYDNLDWFVGVGAHIGSLNKSPNNGNNSFLFGADLIGGLEYAFPNAPFSFSVDWKPAINFTGNYTNHWYFGFGVSLRYTFDW
jgi:hypothetical protein